MVSDCGSLTRNVSNFIDYFFKPICEVQDSYLQDSGHLIALTRTVLVSDSDIPFTMDIESSHTNVPSDESVDISSGLLRRHPDTTGSIFDVSVEATSDDERFQVQGYQMVATKWSRNGEEFRWLLRKSFHGSLGNIGDEPVSFATNVLEAVSGRHCWSVASWRARTFTLL